MIDLSEELVRWVEGTTGTRLVSAERHFAGASREAWRVDTGGADETRQALFLLKDKGGGGGSARDAAVLRALAATDVPAPRVRGLESERGFILLERLAGDSDFPAIENEAEREQTAHDLMRVAARLHALDIDRLKIDHLLPPDGPGACAQPLLESIRGALDTLGPAADPFFVFAHAWLVANVPEELDRVALVHSDLGPGNFLFADGRVTGLVDWEVAHFGDPMEDLAALTVRDMATPVGSLARRLDEYASASGHPVSLERIHYYRAAVLVRNALLIALGLANPPEGYDVVEMTLFHTLLARAATLVLCDNLGVPRPQAGEALPEPGEPAGRAAESRAVFLETLRRDLEGTIRPAVERASAASVAPGPAALSRGLAALSGGLAALTHEARVAAALDRREVEEIAALLADEGSASAASLDALESRLAEVAEERAADSAAIPPFARYFARRFHRLAERRRPLMGGLADRLPQPLEER